MKELNFSVYFPVTLMNFSVCVWQRLKRMIQFGSKANIHLEHSPEAILEEINFKVTQQQNQFNEIWKNHY